MRIELPDLARSILDALLNQFEQPNRRRVARVRLNERQHHEYFYANDFAVRRDANEVMRRLAEQGCLRLHWRKWEEDNWLDKVDLIASRAEEIYKLLGRAPLDEQEAMLWRLLAKQSPKADWHTGFLAWTRRQLDTRASIAPLRLSSAPDYLRWNRDLLVALEAITNLSSPTLERKFSAQVFGDSKRFEDLRGAVVNILRRHDPESYIYGDDDRALLRARHLDRAPEYVPVAGPLALRIEDRLVDLTPFAPSVALSAAMLREAVVSDCAAHAVVTVENLTSFSEIAVAKPASILAIFTGGFASPTVISLLRNIRGAHSDLPFYHWGDLDAGGLRILAHLRKHLGEIKPLAMDAATFDAHRKHARPLGKNERGALAQLREQAQLADCAPLIERLLETNEKLEQEAVEAPLRAQTTDEVKTLSEANYTIRQARVEELPLLQEIERASGELFAEIGLNRVAEDEPLPLDFLRDQQRLGLVWVAADASDRPVGSAATRELDGALHIEEIAVHPAHGRRGLGKRLIETLCDWARGQGYPAITLSTFRDVPWNAPYYARIGFRVLEESETSEGLSALLNQEEQAWHPLARVCMRRDLSTEHV
jgi:predicted N-acetyltransferase YhbS